ncbi:Acetyltransferase (GNAT) family protein [Raineyella antarctica]|uniref:Acetyltransferase (GNAT) family protein n=1 Tax=Raineyella antarctica TaxID=1577474 RepID=A0A1G6GFH3_9ACTN|nr:GNAT family N-acetyltransferase [Raineyella antarctica]SDB79926.1 Acetyltransferase (GNAT) family protein [Raineyella antarctica]
MHLRWAGPQDADLLQEALLGTVNWDPGRPPVGRDELLHNPQLVRYLATFEDEGAFGIVGEAEARPIGVVWAVRFREDAPGYGFVSAEAPEIGLWVRPDHRGQGHGHELLGSLVHEAQRRRLPGLSLSVDSFNPAATLYREFGFRTVGTSGDSETMLLTLG